MATIMPVLEIKTKQICTAPLSKSPAVAKLLLRTGNLEHVDELNEKLDHSIDTVCALELARIQHGLAVLLGPCGLLTLRYRKQRLKVDSLASGYAAFLRKRQIGPQGTTAHLEIILIIITTIIISIIDIIIVIRTTLNFCISCITTPSRLRQAWWIIIFCMFLMTQVLWDSEVALQEMQTHRDARQMCAVSPQTCSRRSRTLPAKESAVFLASPSSISVFSL